MDITVSDALAQRIKRAVASGQYRDASQLAAQAIDRLLDQRQLGLHRVEALRRLGDAVDQAGFYDKVFVPAGE